jgi:hypothetical protein
MLAAADGTISQKCNKLTCDIRTYYTTFSYILHHTMHARPGINAISLAPPGGGLEKSARVLPCISNSSANVLDD